MEGTSRGARGTSVENVSLRVFCVASARTERLQQLADAVNAYVQREAAGYVWQYEPLLFHVVAPPGRAPGGRNRDVELSPTTGAYVCANLRYGDNLEDEWFATWLLHSWLGCADAVAAGAVAHLEDSVDGQFLCVEAAEQLPDWMDPDVMLTRVFLTPLGLHAVSPPGGVAPPLPLSLSDGAGFVREGGGSTLLPPAVQAALGARLSGYPARALRTLHTARVYLPPRAAAALLSSPRTLVPTAVHALVSRDDGETGRAVRMRSVLGGQRVEAGALLPVSLTMSKVHYAQLAGTALHPPKLYTPALPSEGAAHGEWRAYTVGIKLAVGLELAMLRTQVGGGGSAAQVVEEEADLPPPPHPWGGHTTLRDLVEGAGVASLPHPWPPRADVDDDVGWMGGGRASPPPTQGGGEEGGPPSDVRDAVAGLVKEMEGEMERAGRGGRGKGRGSKSVRLDGDAGQHRGSPGVDEERDEEEEEEEEDDGEEEAALRSILTGVRSMLGAQSGYEGVEGAAGKEGTARLSRGSHGQPPLAWDTLGEEGEEGEEGKEEEEDSVEAEVATSSPLRTPVPHLSDADFLALLHAAGAAAVGAHYTLPPAIARHASCAYPNVPPLPEGDTLWVPVLGGVEGDVTAVTPCVSRPGRRRAPRLWRPQEEGAGGGSPAVEEKQGSSDEEGEDEGGGTSLPSLSEIMDAQDEGLSKASGGRLGQGWAAMRVGGGEEEGGGTLPGGMSAEEMGLNLAQGLASAVAAQQGGAGPASTLIASLGATVPPAWWAGGGGGEETSIRD